MKHTGLKGYDRYVALYQDMEKRLAIEGLQPSQTIMRKVEWETTVAAYKNTYKQAGIRLRDATAVLVDQASYPITYKEAKGLKEAIKAAGITKEDKTGLPVDVDVHKLRRSDVKMSRKLLEEYPELSDMILNTYHELASTMGSAGASKAIANRFFGGSP